MKTSTICAMAGLWLSFEAAATGVMPVFDVDFTRTAAETLKKHGIDDACIIRASDPVAFTYCREGSSTLWKYQDLDLAQVAAIKSDALLPSTAYQQISIIEFNSPVCKQETSESIVEPAMAQRLALGLAALSLLLGLRYIYLLIFPRRLHFAALSEPGLQPTSRTLPHFHSTKKAVAALGIAAALTFVYFGYLGF
ncbi:hypothetical protein [Pseudomonas sp. PD9R]|uniref:hypothetical protein n=1 Tax=Pseudomonas sp. PD9R TaxID=2853534 RepID=UPI001C47AF16|nr:hypothetical protein [Pseudomonas sp. PD9R]MBV6821950.1 hypothetical protein [Pseudomonas sp. PD9R]